MSFARMMEGPEHQPHTMLRQIGWLGQTGAFYPWPTPHDVIKQTERGGYMPVYIEVGE